MEEALVRVVDLCKVYNPGENEVRALDHVNLEIHKGEFVAIIGQSGSGKSTFMNMLGCLDVPTSGKYYLNGTDVSTMKDNDLSVVRNKEIGFIFQGFNLIANLTAIENVELPLIYRGIDRKTRRKLAVESLKKVGLEKRMDHKPNEMSGGQQQRVAIARALALNPEFVVCDEPVSALDVSIQAQIINLLKELQDKYNLTYLFISHDLSVVEHISDTVGVMYLGNLVEYGATPDIFSHPLHPYTKALFSAIPIPDPTIRRERIVLQGSIPSPANPPKGCKFHTRCPYATERCKTEVPQQREVEPGHYVVCHLYEK